MLTTTAEISMALLTEGRVQNIQTVTEQKDLVAKIDPSLANTICMANFRQICHQGKVGYKFTLLYQHEQPN